MQGVQGPSGPTGALGTAGTNGTNGTQSFILTGGDLGFAVQAFNFFASDCANQFLLGNNQTVSPCGLTKPAQTGVFDPFNGTTPLYYGPGNGVDSVIESVTVPIDQAVASHLYVETAVNPGAGNSYTFNLCINTNCKTGVTCTINLATATECNDLVDTQVYNQGDDIALEGIATSGNTPPNVNATNVKWSVVLTQTTAPSPTATPTATPSAVPTTTAVKAAHSAARHTL